MLFADCNPALHSPLRVALRFLTTGAAAAAAGKRHRMRESMFFADPPSYYDHPKGFIAFDFAIPDAMLNASTPRTKDYTIGNAAGHFELVHHQLRQLRHAFALATVTGRALVIPQLWCGLDRWWAPHTGEAF